MVHQLIFRFLSITGSSDTSKETVKSNPPDPPVATHQEGQNGGQQKGSKQLHIFFSLKKLFKDINMIIF